MFFKIRDLLWRNAHNRQISQAILVAGSSNLAVKTAALVKEAFVAAIFGVSFDLDVYLVALMLIGLPHGIVVNAVQWTLLPEFVRTRTQSDQVAARLLLRQTVSLNLVLLVAVLGAWTLVLPWIQPFFVRELGSESLQHINACYFILVAYYFTSGTLLLGYAVLQADRQFKANGLVPLTTPIVSIFMIAISQKPGASTLAAGMVVGFLIELGIVESILRRNGWTLVPTRLSAHNLPANYLRNISKFATGAVVISMLPLVEQVAAAQLGVGGISTLGFANKLPAVVSSLSVVAVSIAVFPYFSEMLANKDYARCRVTLRLYSGLLLGVGTVASVILIGLSSPIVNLFFQRGAFSDTAAASVTSAQMAYLLQLPGALVLTLSQKLIQARIGGWRLLLLNLLQLAFYIVLVLTALRVAPSPTTLALSSSLAILLAAALSYRLALQTLAAKENSL